jgi:ribose/xylose/arabinose/galactoside ABC-type transport system permease subunit
MVIMTNILTVIKIPEFGRQVAQGLIILIILLVYGRGRKYG